MRCLAYAAGWCFLLVASPVWAVQTHGSAEGLVAHQIGHCLFTAGMAYLLYSLRRTGVRGRGWREFRVFLWLIVLWNILTFSGHWLNSYVTPRQFIKADGVIRGFVTLHWLDYYFYFTRLDHLVLVPSFVFLLLALRQWRASP